MLMWRGDGGVDDDDDAAATTLHGQYGGERVVENDANGMAGLNGSRHRSI
jgi:hypothetical protein